MKLVSLVGFILFLSIARGQNSEELFNKAMTEFDKENYQKAEEYLDESLNLQRGSYIAWYYKGIVHLLQREYYEAIVSFNESCIIHPEYNKTITYRGLARQKTTDYDGAMADYSRAIELDPTSSESLSFRGSLYELLGDRKKACSDFTDASLLGDRWAHNKVAECLTDSVAPDALHVILSLRHIASSKQYGFSPTKPIRVGCGPDGGPANQRAYLELLRDAQGNPVKYRRIGSQLNRSKNIEGETAEMLDKYEIQYENKKGRLKSKVIYLSFYEYEEPHILVGFNTAIPF